MQCWLLSLRNAPQTLQWVERGCGEGGRRGREMGERERKRDRKREEERERVGGREMRGRGGRDREIK